MATWKPSDGYFGTLLAALFGATLRREPGEQNSGGGGSAAAGHAVNSDSAMRLSAVWACVKLISECVAAMPVRVWRNNDDGTRSLATDHWLFKLFASSPNAWQTTLEFVETIAISLTLTGNFYVRLVRRSDGSIITMTPLMPQQVRVELLPGGERIYYYQQGGTVEAIAAVNIWHCMAMPSTGVVGLSPIQYGARSMGIAMAAEDRVANLAANGFKPAGVLMIDTVLTPDQRAAVRKNFADLQEGQGDPLKVLEAGMTYQQVSINPKDAQLLESRRFQIEDICRFFGVPSVMVNDTSATTVWGTGIAQIKEGFFNLTLQPLLERIEASAAKWLLSASDRGIYEVEFDFTSFLRGNESARVETLTKAISGKLLTIDEARKRFDNLEPLPDGKGAVMYDQNQMQPIGTEFKGDAKPPNNPAS